MTVFDPLDDEPAASAPSMSHVSARQEYRNLVGALNLPVAREADAAVGLTQLSANEASNHPRCLAQARPKAGQLGIG